MTNRESRIIESTINSTKREQAILKALEINSMQQVTAAVANHLRISRNAAHCIVDMMAVMADERDMQASDAACAAYNLR